MIYLCLFLLSFISGEASDSYRWLEDDCDPKVIEWVAERSQETEAYLGELPHREEIRKRLYELVDYPNYGFFKQAGMWIVFSKQEAEQNQPVIFVQEEGGPEEILLDPNTLYPEGTVSLSMINSSKSGSLWAYAERRNDSDWSTLKIIDLETKQILSDHLEWVKFSSVAWKGNGFYYSRFDTPEKGKELSALSQNMKLFFHKIGESQEQDALVWEDPEHPLRYFYSETIVDERYLVLTESEGTCGRQVRVKDLEKNTPFEMLVEGFEFNPEVITKLPEGFLVLTDEEAPNKKLVVIGSETRTIIPEGTGPIEEIVLVGKRLFVTRLKDVVTEALEMDLEGRTVRKLDLPGMGTVGLSYAGEVPWIFYGYSSFTEPTAFYRFDFETGKSTVFKKSVNSLPDIEVEQIFYHSLDGTKIPMFLLHKKGLKKNHNNPTLLYGYGGFGISMVPHFSPHRLFWLEHGGVIAIPNIRGGGEYGEAWHQGGKGLNKQNSFDDFIFAAKWLIQEGWTKKEKLAIEGASNGGLLVGACMTQRPDLFQVAVPHVGVLDMLRFHLFTVGWGWVVEYGSPDKPEDYENLLSYSPLHNVKPNTSYPHTLIFTSDHDDRVVPAHSFKFYAALKAVGAPVHLHVTKNAGHGAGTSLKTRIDQMTDFYAFLFHHLL